MLAKGRILSLVCAASLGLLAAPALATPVT